MAENQRRHSPKKQGSRVSEKVSEGLKRRKRLLGDEYHSEETKKKIGTATREHWEAYDEETRNHMLEVLNDNAQKLRTFGPYDSDWKRISRKIRTGNVCHRCLAFSAG